MKKFIIILFTLLVGKSFGQSFSEKIAAEFYSRIDSNRKLECCDSLSQRLVITHIIPLYQLPYFGKFDMVQFQNDALSPEYIDIMVDDLVEVYNSIPKSVRNKITKSCYSINSQYYIDHSPTGSNFYWAEGSLKIQIYFQSSSKKFGIPWYKKIFRVFKLLNL